MEINEKARIQKAWSKSAHDDLNLAKDLFKLKYYSYSLFFCHLALEKLLKACFVKTKNTYPAPTHKLAKIAKDAEMKLTETQIAYLNEITTFNIEARYDVIKAKLYKKATKDFAEKYLKITKELYTHFLSHL